MYPIKIFGNSEKAVRFIKDKKILRTNRNYLSTIIVYG